MRLLQRLTILIFILVFLSFSAYTVYDKLYVDHTPPVITMDADVIEISVKDPREKLLEGVTAHDAEDGDITGEIIIRGISGLVTDDTARVSYAVFDKADNMTTAQRTVRYTDYERPHFSLSTPLIYSMNDTIVVNEVLSATDRVDGDVTANIRVTSQNVNAAVPGTYYVTVMVSNSLGDAETLTLPVIINNASAANQQIRLSDYVVYVDQGTDFDPLSLIVSMRDQDGDRIALDKSNVQVIGYPETETPGAYQISYTYQSYTVYATVIVK